MSEGIDVQKLTDISRLKGVEDISEQDFKLNFIFYADIVSNSDKMPILSNKSLLLSKMKDIPSMLNLTKKLIKIYQGGRLDEDELILLLKAMLRGLMLLPPSLPCLALVLIQLMEYIINQESYSLRDNESLKQIETLTAKKIEPLSKLVRREEVLELFKNEKKLLEKLKQINGICPEDLNNEDDEEKDEKKDKNKDEYLYVINRVWYNNFKYTLDFIEKNGFDYKEKEEEYSEFFDKEKVFKSFMQGDSDVYCGPLNNFAVLSFKDTWREKINYHEKKEEDPSNPHESEEEKKQYNAENIVIKDDADYVLVKEKEFNMIKNVFGAEDIYTIRMKKSQMETITCKLLILSKVFTRYNAKNQIKFKNIVIPLSCNLDNLRNRISSIVSSYIPKVEGKGKGKIKQSLYYIEDLEKIEAVNIMSSYCAGNSKCDMHLKGLKRVQNQEEYEELINLIKRRHKRIKMIAEVNMKQDKNVFFSNLEDEKLHCHFCDRVIDDSEEQQVEMKSLDNEENKEESTRDNSTINTDGNGPSDKKKAEKIPCKLYSACRILYCSKECKEKDLPHSEFHNFIQEFEEEPIDTENIPTTSEGLFRHNSKRGLTGVYNLGNTCFMNSALQCLSHCYGLTQFFLTQKYRTEINRNTKFGSGGEVAMAYEDLLKQLWIGSDDAVRPTDFRTIFIRYAKQFAGFSQHDSHEALTFMLDNLHEDLNRNKDKQYVEHKEQEPDETDFQASERWWKMLKQRDDSIIVDLFYGQYKSTVKCNVCDKISITYDPFMCLGVPIAGTMTKGAYLIDMVNEGKLFNISIKFDKEDSVENIIKQNFPDSDKFYYKPILCQENMYYAKALNNTDLISSLLNKLRDPRIIIYRFNKEDVEGKIPIYITPIYNERGEDTPLFYPCIFWYKPEDLVENIYKDIEKYYKVFIDAEKMPYEEEEENEEENDEEKKESDSDKEEKDEKEEEKKDDDNQEAAVAVAKQEKDEDDEAKENVEEESSKKNKKKKEKVEKNPRCIKADEKYLLRFVNNISIPSNYRYRCEQCNSHCKLCNFKFDKTDTIQKIKESQYKERNILLDLEIPKIKDPDYEGRNLNENECSKLLYSEYDQYHTNREGKECNLNCCLKTLSKEEQLDENNTWYCPKCKEQRQAYKQIQVMKTSKYLIIQLKRFKTSEHSFSMFGNSKNDAEVDFPIDKLCMDDYLAHPDKEHPKNYKLIGISHHMGSSYGGHYVASCRDHNNWYRFDDSSVYRISDSNLVSSSAYLLIYELIDN